QVFLYSTPPLLPTSLSVLSRASLRVFRATVALSEATRLKRLWIRRCGYPRRRRLQRVCPFCRTQPRLLRVSRRRGLRSFRQACRREVWLLEVWLRLHSTQPQRLLLRLSVPYRRLRSLRE